MKPIVFVRFDIMPSPEDMAHIMAGMEKRTPKVVFIASASNISFACILPEGFTVHTIKFDNP